MRYLEFWVSVALGNSEEVWAEAEKTGFIATAANLRAPWRAP